LDHQAQTEHKPCPARTRNDALPALSATKNDFKILAYRNN